MTNHRVFDPSDFTIIHGKYANDLLINCASDMGMPPGKALKFFEVKGLGMFTLLRSSEDSFMYRSDEGNGFAEVFND
jgi:hypothetical protein